MGFAGNPVQRNVTATVSARKIFFGDALPGGERPRISRLLTDNDGAVDAFISLDDGQTFKKLIAGAVLDLPTLLTHVIVKTLTGSADIELIGLIQ